MKSIEHGYIRIIIRVSVFQVMGSSTVVRHETVLGSIVQVLLEVSFCCNFFFVLIQFWQI